MSASRVTASSIAQGLPKSRSLLAGNYAYGGGATWLIERINVGSGGAASVTFSSIPQTFKHLQLRLSAQTNRGTYAGDSCLMTVNSDTGTNYPQHSLQGDGSTATATGTTTSYSAMNMRNTMGSSAGPGFAAAVADFLDYTNTSKYKTLRYLGGSDNNGTVSGYGGYVVFGSSVWLSTVAITSLVLKPESGTLWNQYSTFALYGVVG